MSAQLIISGEIDPFGRSVPDFIVGVRHSVFEWCMIYTDRHPGIAADALFRSGDYNEPTIKGMDARLTQLGAVEKWRGTELGASGGTTHNPGDLDPGPEFCAEIGAPVQFDAPKAVKLAFMPRLSIYPHTDDPAWVSNEVYRELVTGIKGGGVAAEKATHCRDDPALPDYTLFVIHRDPVLDIARRRGDAGSLVSGILAECQANAPKPSAANQRDAYELRLAEFQKDGRIPPLQTSRKTGVQGDREWAAENGVRRQQIERWRQEILGEKAPRRGRPRNSAQE